MLHELHHLFLYIPPSTVQKQLFWDTHARDSAYPTENDSHDKIKLKAQQTSCSTRHRSAFRQEAVRTHLDSIKLFRRNLFERGMLDIPFDQSFSKEVEYLHTLFFVLLIQVKWCR